MAINFDDVKNIWVFAEQRHGKLMNVALELIGEGYRLSREMPEGTKVCGILIGAEEDVKPLEAELFAYGADEVYTLASPLLKNYTTDGYTKVLQLLKATSNNKEFVDLINRQKNM